MIADKNLESDLLTEARFLQARTGLENGEYIFLLDFKLDCEPSPVTVSMKLPPAGIQKIIHTCLKALGPVDIS